MDGRSWLYSTVESSERVDATDQGLVATIEHRAFGFPNTEFEDLNESRVRRHLEEAIAESVCDRRAGRRASAIDKLSVVIREASKRNFTELELRARCEIATTSRQENRSDELIEQVSILREFQFGKRKGAGPAAAIAAAHANYESGRPGPPGHVSPQQMYALLVAAETGYSQLAGEQPQDPEWRMRRGWARLGIADNLRQQTQFGRALHHVSLAEFDFGKEDAYGRARTLFMRGFCLRLRGQFARAQSALVEALHLNMIHDFQMFEADARGQLGEVARCLGEHESSRKYLEAAGDLGRKFQLPTTRAFAESGLGALSFAEGEYDTAIGHLTASNDTFESCGNTVGHALTLRRLATVCRHASPEYNGTRNLEELRKNSNARSVRLFASNRSPAGLATCVIEHGRWGLATGHAPTVDESCDVLARLVVGDRANHSLLRLDPCVPQLISDFAAETESVTVSASAEQLLRDVKERNEVSQSAPQPIESTNAEMACEPRCIDEDGRWLDPVINSAVTLIG
ncbi:MAG TPA: hypothetical protein VHV31_09980 [Nitrolancea sp.]|jgi:tetratricopeptide (TPR) repeat protein|nr:hypothetical protein [Nitrolancea sp.]